MKVLFIGITIVILALVVIVLSTAFWVAVLPEQKSLRYLMEFITGALVGCLAVMGFMYYLDIFRYGR